MDVGSGPDAGLELRRAGTRVSLAGATLVAGLLTLTLPALLLWLWVRPGPLRGYGWDFRAFYDAAQAYLHLRSPYPSPTLAAMATQENFVYPPPVAALFTPWTLLPFPAAAVLFIVASAACLVLALHVLGVRDWRCYAVALLALPTQDALKLATLMPALTLLLALAWRYRDRRALAVPVLATLAVAKLFLWPIGIWYLATRRTRTAVAAAGVAIAGVFLAALPLGLDVLRVYPRVLGVVSAFEGRFGYTPTGLALELGAARTLATALAVALGGALLVAVVWAAQSGREQLSFRLALAASFALTPVAWGHYFVLLFVPLALLRPRFSPLWVALAWAPGSPLAAFEGRALVVAGALVCAVLQLGLLPLPPLPRARLASSFAFVAASAATVAAVSIVVEHVDRIAALHPVARADASGVAFVRFKHASRTICWQLWTDGVPANARGWITGADGTRVALGPLQLDSSGDGTGCAPGVAPLVKQHPRRYGVLLTTGESSQGLIGGPLYRTIEAGDM